MNNMSTLIGISPTAPPATRLRWKLGLAILLLALAGVIAGWLKFDSNRSYQVLILWIGTPATGLLMTIWWLFLSGLRWRTRLKGAAIAIVIGVLLKLSLRIEQYSGDVLPILAFRWTPTRDQRAEAYWKSRPPWEQVGSEAIAIWAVTKPVVVTEADWPEFRGRDRDGVVRGLTRSQLRLDWATQPPRELWRHPVWAGWSSFAVAGHRAFTQEQRGPNETVVCYDIGTGVELWSHEDATLFGGPGSGPFGGDGPRATPTIHDGKVFSLGATGILNCLDAATGFPRWSVNILEDNDAKNLEWGLAASPLVIDDKVIVNPGGTHGCSVAAYDIETGRKVWASGNNPTSYSSPQRLDVDGRPVILMYDALAFNILDASTGEPLCTPFGWINDAKINCTQPAVWQDGDRIKILVGTGYSKGSVLLSLDHTGETGWSLAKEWESFQIKPKFNGLIVRDGHVYGLDEGLLTCLRLSDGQRRWKRGRFGFGQMLLIDDLLLIQAESGDVVLVEATPDRFHELTRFPALTSKTWNNPVVVHGKLLVRNSEEAACFELVSGQ